MNNLKSFRAEQKMQQATITFIASNITSKSEKESLLKTFKALDKNGDGILSREEIIEGYKQIMDEDSAIIGLLKKNYKFNYEINIIFIFFF